MIAPHDLAACRAAIQEGSYSFYAASKLLPASVRDPALALYAFCRLADDAVDFSEEKPAAVLGLSERLEAVYAGRPQNTAPDRAFAAIVEQFEMPRALPEALLEGLAWDGIGRRYRTLSDLRAYSARVAAAVGAMMCVLMRVRDGDALARACDLGVAMQLTNIARDVGEDARAGRLYLPTSWLAEVGIDADAFLADPQMSPELGYLIRRLLVEAERLYTRSEAGIAALPITARPGIFAARHIYAAIGGVVRHQRYDSITRRARTTAATKIALLGVSAIRAAWVGAMPRNPVIFAKPLTETAFLVEAAAHAPRDAGRWSESVLDVLIELKARDHAQELDRRGSAPI
ncbi:MAG: phytoene/squalene synthase family protein [Pseudomonadota bacterium]